MPGIGHKSAQRLAFHVLNMKKEEAEAFSKAILEAHEKIKKCSCCCNLAEEELCPICKSSRRDESVVCVVEDPRDVMAFERTHEFEGTYHVLHGVISPMNGIGPEDITIKELLSRMGDGKIQEVIMATNPDVEGEATAMYIATLLKPLGVKVTRLAHGIAVGTDIEYADVSSLSRAIIDRRDM